MARNRISVSYSESGLLELKPLTVVSKSSAANFKLFSMSLTSFKIMPATMSLTTNPDTVLLHGPLADSNVEEESDDNDYLDDPKFRKPKGKKIKKMRTNIDR